MKIKYIMPNIKSYHKIVNGSYDVLLRKVWIRGYIKEQLQQIVALLNRISISFLFLSGQVQTCLRLNYHFFYEDIVVSHIEIITIVYDLLSILSYQCLFLADIKHEYLLVNVHFDDRNYLAFHVSRIEQTQPTCMPQRARTSCFTFSKLINIVLGSISTLQSKSSLFYGKTAKDSALLAFYMDNYFEAFKTYQKQYIFLYNYFFPRMVWSKLKLILSKLKIEITKIFALEEEYAIDRKIKLKLNKIEKIFF